MPTADLPAVPRRRISLLLTSHANRVSPTTTAAGTVTTAATDLATVVQANPASIPGPYGTGHFAGYPSDHQQAIPGAAASTPTLQVGRVDQAEHRPTPSRALDRQALTSTICHSIGHST